MNASETYLIRRLMTPNLMPHQNVVLRALCVLHLRGKLPLVIRLGWDEISRFERLCDVARLTESDCLKTLAQLTRKRYVLVERGPSGRYACRLNPEKPALQSWTALGFTLAQRVHTASHPFHYRSMP